MDPEPKVFTRRNEPIKVEVGEIVTRLLAGTIPMKLKVTEVTDTRIVCGAWEFDRVTGGEIDEDLGWDAYNTGSVLEPRE